MLRSSFVFASASVLALSAAWAGDSQHSLAGSKLALRDLVATVDIKIVPGAQGVQVTLSGEQTQIDRVVYAEENGTAVVKMKPDNAIISMNWSDALRMTVTIAPGTPLEIANLVGAVSGGDLDAPLTVDASASGDITLGRVSTASIDIRGSSNVTLGVIQGTLDLDASGSGDLKAVSAAATSISLSGSGDAELGAVMGSLGVETSGSGDVKIGQVDGATQIETSGSGNVAIGGGRANPFAASSSGSGDITFGGLASNPQVSTSGSGDVCIAKADGAVAISGESITIDPAACTQS